MLTTITTILLTYASLAASTPEPASADKSAAPQKKAERTVLVSWSEKPPVEVPYADLTVEQQTQVDIATRNLAAETGLDVEAISCELDISADGLIVWCDGEGYMCWAGCILAGCDADCCSGDECEA